MFIVLVKVKVAQSCPTLRTHGLYSPCNSPGQNTGVGSFSLLQGIFPTQGSNPGLLHCRRILYQLNHKGSPLSSYPHHYSNGEKNIKHTDSVVSIGNISSVQLVSQLCLTLCDPMDCSAPGFPVHHQLPELPQTHVYRVCDAIQLSLPLLSPSLPALDLFQQQGLFQWIIFVSGGQSIGISALASVLPMNIQGCFPLGLIVWISLQSKGLSRVFSNTTVPKTSIFQPSAFLMVQLSHPYNHKQKDLC